MCKVALPKTPSHVRDAYLDDLGERYTVSSDMTQTRHFRLATRLCKPFGLFDSQMLCKVTDRFSETWEQYFCVGEKTTTSRSLAYPFLTRAQLHFPS